MRNLVESKFGVSAGAGWTNNSCTILRILWRGVFCWRRERAWMWMVQYEWASALTPSQQVRDCTVTSRRTGTTVLHSCSLLVRAQLQSHRLHLPVVGLQTSTALLLHPHPARPRSHLRPPASAPLSRRRSASPDAAPVPPTCAVLAAAVAVHTPMARRCAVRLLTACCVRAMLALAASTPAPPDGDPPRR